MPYVYRVRLHRDVGVLALVVSRLRCLRYDRDAGNAEGAYRPPRELPYAHLARYLPCTSEGARYAACEDFAFSFMLILGFLFRCLSEEGAMRTWRGFRAPHAACPPYISMCSLQTNGFYDVRFTLDFIG